MLVEVLAGHDRVRSRHRIAAEGAEARCTIGRGAASDVVLDDPFVAPVHARVTTDADGTVRVTDLDTVNGVEIAGYRVHGIERALPPDGTFRIGRTRLRVRTGREILPGERKDDGAASWSRDNDPRWLAAGFVVTVGMAVFDVWTNTVQPNLLAIAIVTALLGMFATAGLWIVLWALATRVAFGESRWIRHATILFGVGAVVEVGWPALAVANGALGLHLPAIAGMLMIGAAVSVLLAAHLVAASPMRPRMAVVIGIVIPVLAIGAVQWMRTRTENRSATHVANRDHLVPPALLLRRGAPLPDFTAKLAGLTQRADANRAFVETYDPSPGDDGE